MFADIVSDALNSITDSLTADYAYADVYPRSVVIDMIASMLVARAVSDIRGPDGKFMGGQTLSDIRRKARAEAIKIYDSKMNGDISVSYVTICNTSPKIEKLINRSAVCMTIQSARQLRDEWKSASDDLDIHTIIIANTITISPSNPDIETAKYNEDKINNKQYKEVRCFNY